MSSELGFQLEAQASRIHWSTAGSVQSVLADESTLVIPIGKQLHLLDITRYVPGNLDKNLITTVNCGCFVKLATSLARLGLVAVSGWQQRNIQVYQYDNEQRALKSTFQLAPPENEKSDYVAMAISRDGQFLVAATNIPFSRVHVWDLNTGKLAVTSADLDYLVDSIVFCPEDSQLFYTIAQDKYDMSVWEIIPAHQKRLLKQKAVSYPVNDIESPLQWITKDSPIVAHCWIEEKTILVCHQADNFLLVDGQTGVIQNKVDIQYAHPICGVVWTRRGLIWHSKNSLHFGDVKPVLQISEEISVDLMPNDSIRSIKLAPKHHFALITSQHGSTALFDMHSRTVTMIEETLSGPIDTCEFLSSDVLVQKRTVHKDLILFKVKGKEILHKFTENVSAHHVNSTFQTVAIGSVAGIVNVYQVQSPTSPRLVYSEKLHGKPVQFISLDPVGRFLFTYGDKAILTCPLKASISLTLTDIPGRVTGFTWNQSITDEKADLFILSQNDNTSVVTRFVIGTVPGGTRGEIKPVQSINIPGCVTSITVPQSDQLWAFGVDRKLKKISLLNPKDVSAKIIDEFEDFKRSSGGMNVDATTNSIFAWCQDGQVVYRYLSVPKMVYKTEIGNPIQGGIRHAQSFGQQVLITTYDGSLALYGLKKSGKNTIEFRSLTLSSYMQNALDSFSELEEVEEEKPSVTESADGKKLGLESIDANVFKDFQKLDNDLTMLLDQNNSAPDNERLDISEFFVDREQEKYLQSSIETEAQDLETKIINENLVKKVLKKRLTEEFVKTSHTVGKCIRSFLELPALGKNIVIDNYALKKQDPAYLRTLDRIKIARKTQLAIDNFLAARLEMSTNDRKLHKQFSESVTLGLDMLSLLYHPSELTTNERKSDQMVLYQEVIRQIKTKFNKLFEEYVKMKETETQKMSERNDRIQEIFTELDLKEKVPRFVAADDEVPERILEVLDSEIKAVKITANQKSDDKKRSDEQKIRGQEDRRRAALPEVVGSLDAKKSDIVVDDLVPPASLNKPEAELTNEERKANQEYLAKVKLVKEETEKKRKSLEAEYRKLQTANRDTCLAFDNQLLTLLDKRIEFEQLIQRIELMIIMLNQSVFFWEEEDREEKRILKSMDTMKLEKNQWSAEIPVIKKDLEKRREEYEAILKIDRDLEKQFKKEFAAYDFYFERLQELFKIRQADGQDNDDQADNQYASQATVDEPPQPVKVTLTESDCPEGLQVEVWKRFLELREEKITCEAKVQKAFESFSELQKLVSLLLENSERIRILSEEASKAMAAVQQRRFALIYDSKQLFEFPQHQIEVHQEPVATDYGGAVLIDREMVENLNQSILASGKTKIQALMDMKEYRKGIHLLEWENSVLEFESDNVLGKVRDIQLLRLTEEMQEYLRNGEKKTGGQDIAALEKRLDYNDQAHQYQMSLKNRTLKKMTHEISDKSRETEKLHAEIEHLGKEIQQRQERLASNDFRKAKKANEQGFRNVLSEKKLKEQLEAQRKELEFLRAEATKWRKKNYPHFKANVKPASIPQ